MDETAQIRAEPPRTRFMDMEEAGELKMSEVAELLRDYQRLGRVLENLRIVGEEDAAVAEGEGFVEGKEEGGTAPKAGGGRDEAK